MTTVWRIAAEYLRRTFLSKVLILVLLVAVLFIIIGSCFFGGNFYMQGQTFDRVQQLSLARAVAYHLAVGWGVLFAVMLASSAVSRPLEDGRTAMLLSKPLTRGQVLAGQVGGAFLTACATVVGLGVVATVMHLLASHTFPARLWLGLACGFLAILLATAATTFFSGFLPRVVAALLGILTYLISLPAAFPAVRDFMTEDYKKVGMNFPWYVRWGSEVYFAACPPVAGAQFRGADLVAAKAFDLDAWIILATAAVYVVALGTATWAMFSKRDL